MGKGTKIDRQPSPLKREFTRATNSAPVLPLPGDTIVGQVSTDVFDARWYSDWRPDRGRSQEHQSHARTRAASPALPFVRRVGVAGDRSGPRQPAGCRMPGGSQPCRMTRALRPMRELFPSLRFPAALANAYGCTQFAGRASPRPGVIAMVFPEIPYKTAAIADARLWVETV
jgi:hypothetical protein